MGTKDFNIEARYDKAIERALTQITSGKGKARHSGGKDFDDQPIMTIPDIVGEGFLLGQALKKIEESQRLENMSAVAELLGAICYLAAYLKRNAVFKIRDGVLNDPSIGAVFDYLKYKKLDPTAEYIASTDTRMFVRPNFYTGIGLAFLLIKKVRAVQPPLPEEAYKAQISEQVRSHIIPACVGIIIDIENEMMG